MHGNNTFKATFKEIDDVFSHSLLSILEHCIFPHFSISFPISEVSFYSPSTKGSKYRRKGKVGEKRIFTFTVVMAEDSFLHMVLSHGIN